VEGGHIREVRFMCRGCTTAIACASWTTEFCADKTLEELRFITAETISKSLGELPEETKHGAVLAADAVKALLKTI
jgi:NifU-like protein involved in Fe-S cluster formation